ncbi:hypothetical protein QZM89_11295 [Burkholderia gladioli]|uniref:hypothetical protein n=1 Tax=Burkholderia gladioli TaxID=28095 RepID=UPI0016405CB1|nr:hypothetical protein [Burkholderia gladioli]MDN7495769.1 hypothetical protein [Burkholderia gladioli]
MTSRSDSESRPLARREALLVDMARSRASLLQANDKIAAARRLPPGGRTASPVVRRSGIDGAAVATVAVLLAGALVLRPGRLLRLAMRAGLSGAIERIMRDALAGRRGCESSRD